MMISPMIGPTTTSETMNLSSGVVLSGLPVAVDELTLALVVVVVVDNAERLLEPILEVKAEREVIFRQHWLAIGESM